jgi:phosphate:Na+ symporter
VERQPLTPQGLAISKSILELVDRGVSDHLGYGAMPSGRAAQTPVDTKVAIGELRQRCLQASELPGEDRGALLALLGSAERSFYLAERIQAERRSVSRELAQDETASSESIIFSGLNPTAA